MSEINQKLSMLNRSEIIAQYPKTTCADAGVKSIKSGGGTEKLRMLHFPATATLDSVKNEEPNEFRAIVERPKAALLRPLNSFARVTVVSKPTMTQCESK